MFVNKYEIASERCSFVFVFEKCNRDRSQKIQIVCEQHLQATEVWNVDENPCEPKNCSSFTFDKHFLNFEYIQYWFGNKRSV